MCGRALEVVLLSLLALVPPCSVFVDIAYFNINNGISEMSLTELMQEMCLAVSMAGFVHCAIRCRDRRGFYLLMAWLLGSMLIREMDWLFDRIRHGFWVYPEICAALLVFYGMAFRFPGSLGRALVAFVGSRSYPFILFGMIVVLVFSRIIGSSLLLRHLVSCDIHIVKSAVQEGVELFGYLFILYGSVMAVLQRNLRAGACA